MKRVANLILFRQGRSFDVSLNPKIVSYWTFIPLAYRLFIAIKR